MANVNDFFPSNFLKASDIAGRRVAVIIDRLDLEDIGGEEKPVLHFKGKSKGLVLNRTNADSIAQFLGPETDGWVGRGVILYATTTRFKGQSVPCIRIDAVEEKSKPDSDEPF